MKTVSEFAKEKPNKVKEATVLTWISKGYIGGVEKNKDGEWLIPDDARKPYTANRIRRISKQDVILKSILTGINKGYAVFPELYGRTEQDFQSFIDELIEGGYIKQVILSCDVPYYKMTIKGIELMKKGDREILAVLKETIITAGKMADAVKEAAATTGRALELAGATGA
ncbi:MAG: hypothetical protein LUH14_05970 [Clostridiaceae bacterium]|nr:hypothetical protein [Clostridiaceae bacterium]